MADIGRPAPQHTSQTTPLRRILGILLILLGLVGLLNGMRILVTLQRSAGPQSKESNQLPSNVAPVIIFGLALSALMIGGGVWVLGFRPARKSAAGSLGGVVSNAQDEVDVLSLKARKGDVSSLRQLLQIAREERIENLLSEGPSKRNRIAALLADWPYGGSLLPSDVDKIVYESALSSERSTPEAIIRAIHDADLSKRTAADLSGSDPTRREGAFGVWAAMALNPKKPASLRRSLRPVLESASPEVRLIGVRCLEALASQIGKPHDLGDAKWAWDMLRAMTDKDTDEKVRSAAADALADLTGTD